MTMLYCSFSTVLYTIKLTHFRVGFFIENNSEKARNYEILCVHLQYKLVKQLNIRFMSKTITKANMVELIMRGVRMGKSNTSASEQDLKKSIVKLIDNYISTDQNAPYWQQEVETLISEGCQLLAIKTLKESTGLFLREAKDAVNFYKSNGYWNIDESGHIQL